MIEVKRKLPENFIDGHLPYFEPHLKNHLPNPGYSYYSRSILLFSNGILLNRLHVEKQSLLYDTRLKEIGGRLSLIKEIIKSLLKKRVKILSDNNDYVTIINEWTNNYFHWFTEAIPKLIYMLEQGKKPTVLLPTHYNAEYQLRSLGLLGFPYKTFAGSILVSKNIFLPFRLAPYSAHYNPTIMKKLSAKLKAIVSLNVDKGKRIYISRKRTNTRRIINEDEVIDLLKEFNFLVLEFEDYTLDEQISIMHHTDILVSIHGAGLTNMIFCKPETIILELSLKNQIMDKCYFNLANAMDLKYYYQFCESNNDKDSYAVADLFVEIADFRRNILLITANPELHGKMD